MYSHENGTMRPAETIPGMGGGRIKENDGGVNSFVNVTVHPQYNNNKKRFKKSLVSL
jgi:hypothetical protein